MDTWLIALIVAFVVVDLAITAVVVRRIQRRRAGASDVTADDGQRLTLGE